MAPLDARFADLDLDTRVPATGRNDSSASGSLPASSLQRRLFGDESDWSGVAARPSTDVRRPDLVAAELLVARDHRPLSALAKAVELVSTKTCAEVQAQFAVATLLAFANGDEHSAAR